MSSLPPGPPPSSPPPAGPPPSGPPPGVETLEQGGGGRIPPDERPRSSGGGRKRFFLIGGGVVGLGAVGAAAFGAYWYLSTGPQPAEALPAGTLGYVSVDLDPSGSQKIDALRTLKKFPAADDELDLSGDVGDIDVKKVLVEAILDSAPCELAYDDDVESWLGDRGAVAAVDVGDDGPQPVFVLQVGDADAARDGIQKILDCGSEGSEGSEEGETPGIESVGDWIVIAETPKIATAVADATDEGTLADDETFQKWTEAAGDPGIVSMYAAPAAGTFLAENLDDLFLNPFVGSPDFATSCAYEMPAMPEPPDESATPEELQEYFDQLDALSSTDTMPCEDEESTAGDDLDEMTGDMDDELTAALEDFEGMAVTLRFDGGALELETAGDPGAYGDSAYAGDSGADALGSLPGDTAAAFGLGLADGWFDDVLGSVASSLGEDVETLVQEAEDATGLSLPEDAEALLGDSAALAVGGDLDPDELESLDDPLSLPVALKVLGDPDAAEAALDKIRPQLGADEDLLGSSTDGDAIAIGPDADYRDQVLADGDLADSDRYQSVVPDGDDVAAVLFLDLDKVADLVSEGMGFDDQFAANVEPLRALGMSAWEEDGVSHARLRISTD